MNMKEPGWMRVHILQVKDDDAGVLYARQGERRRDANHAPYSREPFSSCSTIASGSN